MEKDTTYIGLDAHQETIHAAMLLPGAEQALTESFENTPEVIRRFVRRLRRRAPGEVVCCYKAGPLGFCLQRSLIRSRLFVRGRGSLADGRGDGLQESGHILYTKGCLGWKRTLRSSVSISIATTRVASGR